MHISDHNITSYQSRRTFKGVDVSLIVTLSHHDNVCSFYKGIIFSIAILITSNGCFPEIVQAADPADPGGIPATVYSTKGAFEGVPIWREETHNIGMLGLALRNWGQIGLGAYAYNQISCEFPIGSLTEYFRSGYIWIGGILDQDTLVSTGSLETRPAEGMAGDFMRRSTLRSSPYHTSEALSEQDFICVYTDTSMWQPYYDHDDNRPHIPLGVSIRQSSYAWSYAYASDFILFDFHVTNIGRDTIAKMFIGYDIVGQPYSYGYDATYESGLCGFRRTAPAQDRTCRDEDSLNVAWLADVEATRIPRENGIISPSEQ